MAKKKARVKLDNIIVVVEDIRTSTEEGNALVHFRVMDFKSRTLGKMSLVISAEQNIAFNMQLENIRSKRKVI